MDKLMKILIVDDSLLAGYALKSYFEKLGVDDVSFAKTGEIGKEMFKEISPDLITVDAIMPGISGFEFIQFLNDYDSKNKKKTKIVMISSEEIPSNERKQIKVDKYLIKPITFQKLKTTVDELF